MKPKHRNRRFARVAFLALVAILGTFILLKAVGENKELFVNPDRVVAADFVQPKGVIRVGGMVVDGSIEKQDGLNILFQIVNFKNPNPNILPLPVHYEGVLPDLFAEGQGVVVVGNMEKNGIFVAKSLMAKHDENYMPKLPD